MNTDFTLPLSDVVFETETLGRECFAVLIVDDFVLEDPETFQIVISSLDRAVVLIPETHLVVTIEDDDRKYKTNLSIILFALSSVLSL